MKPGLEFRQVLRLLGLLARRPVVLARANLRLINRGLYYLAQNPDLVWSRYLLDSAGSAQGMDALILVADQGRPVFSLLLAKGLTGNLPGHALRSFRGLDSFREKNEAELQRPLQAVLVDAAVIDRLNSKLVEEKGLDAFFIAGREILEALARGMIQFSPIVHEAEIAASLDGEELLCKFGPRYGLSRENPVRVAGVIRGLGLALTAPLTRRRMKKHFAGLSE